MNNVYKQVKANKGAQGVDGMTVEEAIPWLKEHDKEMTEEIRRRKYKPTPVKRYEWALQFDLSKYFDTLNHEKLLNLLRDTVKDERVIQLIKKFL